MSKRYLVSQRDIVLIPFPFSDLSQAKFRPAIKTDKVFSLEQKLIARTFGQLRQDVFDSVSTELIKLIR